MQYQVKSNSLQQRTGIPINSLKYSQMPRQPLTQVDNIKPTTKTDASDNKNPYFNQFQKRSSNSGHQEQSNSSQKLPKDSSYAIQFKVGVKNEAKKPSMDISTGDASKFVCQSPQHQREQQSILFQSPGIKKDILQSPMLTQKQSYAQVPYPQLQSQNPQTAQSQQRTQQSTMVSQLSQQNLLQQQTGVSAPRPHQQQINFTTTSLMQQELKKIQEENSQLQQKTQNIESDIHRGLQANFIQQLEQKIKMLTQMNQKIDQENQNLQVKTDIKGLKIQLEKLLSQRTQAQQQLQLLNKELQDQKQKYIQLQHDVETHANSKQLNLLVSELEDRVSGLITENERLNQINNAPNVNDLSKQKQELIEINKKYHTLKKEEDSIKQKIQSLEKGQLNTEGFEDLKEKIQLLVEENQRLGNVINESELTDQDIIDTKERVNYILIQDSNNQD